MTLSQSVHVQRFLEGEIPRQASNMVAKEVENLGIDAAVISTIQWKAIPLLIRAGDGGYVRLTPRMARYSHRRTIYHAARRFFNGLGMEPPSVRMKTVYDYDRNLILDYSDRRDGDPITIGDINAAMDP